MGIRLRCCDSATFSLGQWKVLRRWCLFVNRWIAWTEFIWLHLWACGCVGADRWLVFKNGELADLWASFIRCLAICQLLPFTENAAARSKAFSAKLSLPQSDSDQQRTDLRIDFFDTFPYTLNDEGYGRFDDSLQKVFHCWEKNMNSDGLLPLVLNCSRNVAVHSALTSLRGNESHHCKQGGTAYRRPCSAMVFFFVKMTRQA